MTRLFKTLVLGLAAVAGPGLAHTAVADATIPLRGVGEGQLLMQIDPTPENPVGI